ncbi:MFS transporter [Microcella frigidaquae]|uniref:Multidrug resistance protein n=1 Tax=Microcella frigidaquae TaxID=424758 RepID=A0A840X5H6_9MICO|nr:MFS transporter [Microcella frigidaquae]MBB5617471.1 multidrug resistance protein [Microcella frigidaquae]NHN45340.1 MFS transporter [Microcella frigidaquae]
MTSTTAVGLRSERGPILLAIMVTTGLVAIDATILATAVPTLVAELGSFELFPWLFSIYLLAQAVSTPLFAKFSDMIGRKPIILIGIGLFLLGSILCGLAWSMPALIAFRAAQGIGAGAIGPMAITIAGDIYTVEERAKVQGYIASVWAASAVIGPTLGGLFAELDAWRWIFFINIPLCVLAAWMLIRSLHETVEHRPHRVDVLGALLLTASLGLLLVGVLQGGVSWAWASWQSAVAFGVGAVLLVAFVAVERRAAEPILPGWVFSRRLLLATTLASVGVGAILIGLASYVPVALEGSLGVSPLVAGLALAALTIGWPISAALSGRLYLRLGFRITVLIGMVLVLAGTGLLAAFASTPSVAISAVACFVTGLGLGLVATPSLIAAQASVEWNERGVVTGTNLFARAVGQAVAVAIFGAVANTIYRAAGGGGVLGEGAGAAVDPIAIVPASQAVFVGALLCTVATMALATTMPRDRPRSTAPSEATPAATMGE